MAREAGDPCLLAVCWVGEDSENEELGGVPLLEVGSQWGILTG